MSDENLNNTPDEQAQLQNEQPSQPQYEQPSQPQYGQAPQPQYQQGSPAGNGNPAFDGKAVAGLVCGIISLCLCWTGIGGVVLGIIAIVLRGKGKQSQKPVLANVGFGLGIAGLVVGIIYLIIWLVLGTFAFGAYY
jgi:hypothetical protein